MTLIAHAHGEGRILPIWLSAKNKAIVSVTKVEETLGGNGTGELRVSASVTKDFTNNWEKETVAIVIRRDFGWIDSATDPWLIRAPKIGESYLVYGTEDSAINTLKGGRIHKSLIDDIGIREVHQIIEIEKRGEPAREKIYRVGESMKNVDSMSIFLWSYLHHLISKSPEDSDILRAQLLRMSHDSADIEYFGRMMKDFGYMGRLTPDLRGLGKLLVARYLASTNERHFDDAMKSSFEWVTLFDGASTLSLDEQSELKRLEGVLKGKGFKALPAGFVEKLCESR